jgi:hypothetical protein
MTVLPVAARAAHRRPPSAWQHIRGASLRMHDRYTTFFEYGDAPAFLKGLSRIRRTVTRERQHAGRRR